MATSEAARRGHGWWPYVLPYFAFLLTVEFARRLPAGAEWIGVILKPGIAGGLLVYYARRGAYPELRGIRVQPLWRLADVGVGIALAALWMAPYVWIPAIRPPDAEMFDPNMLGEDLVSVTLGLRMLGYGLVTPFFEEIFIRSFVMRYSEVFRKNGDFRDVPLAYFTWTSFLATAVLFTIGHLPWEYWVCVPWVVATNLWFYLRRDLSALILVHAVTNATILLFVVWQKSVTGPDGVPLSLWFFV